MTAVKQLEILLIEDHPGDARLIREMLSDARGGPFEMECEETLAAGLARLAGQHFDVLILDLSLPDSWGLETLDRALREVRDIPVVVLTGMEDEQASVSALDRGAQDYLVKGRIDPDMLSRSIRYALARSSSEGALRESEEHYRRLVEGIGEVILTLDMDLRVTYASPSVERQAGFKVDEVVGRSVGEFMTPESLERVKLLFAEQLGGQRESDVHPPVAVMVEMELMRKDGSVYPAEVSAGFLRDRNSVPRGVLIVSRDVTEQKEDRARIRDSEEKYRTLFESSLDGIVSVDMDGIITGANRAYLDMLGYSLDEVKGLTYQQLTPEKWHAMEQDLIDSQVNVRGFSDFYEKEYVRRDGSVFPISIRTWLIEDERGEPVGMWAIVRDVTEHKRIEEERRTLNQEMERRVIERTAQLQAANQEMEAFSYSVSHDLRAPLRAIEGFSRMLMEEHSDRLDEEGLRLLSIIRQNSDYMGELIEHLLMLSRVDRRELAEVEVDMNALARQVAEEHQQSLDGRILDFALEDLPPAKGDPLLWHQVWENLLSNAVKFTRYEDRAQVQVGCLKGDGENIYFVKDNGAGFDMKHADRLFGVFRRLHSPEEYEGVGVGLALVQRIVRRHGGRVWAQGKPGEGATFYFTAFPLD